MEKTFRKITGLFSLLLVSMMLVSAGVYPTPFTSNNEANVAIVYGASASADATAANNIANSLADSIVIDVEEFERIFSAGVTEDEVKLGDMLSSKMRDMFTDNQIPSLFDGRISWDDGDDTDNYDIHEEIIIGNIKLETTLDNDELEGVALINDKDLEYRLVFEEDIFVDDATDSEDNRELGTNGADALEVTILGEEYLIEEVDGNSITVTKAKKIFLSEGDTTTVDGKTLTVESIYSGTSSGSVFINGILIKEEEKKTINGIVVKVDEVYYTAKDSGVSKVEIYAGGDISEEYSNGDAFIGQDEDDPEWVWNIEKPGKKGGYIGVKYDLRQVDEEDDVAYKGEEYIFPNGFATVSFDGLTDVEYHNFEVFFDDVDLYAINSSDDDDLIDAYNGDDMDVVIVSGEYEDSFELTGNSEIGSIETDTIYLHNADSYTVEVYYRDVAEDYSNGNKAIWYKNASATTNYTDTDVIDAGTELGNARGAVEDARVTAVAAVNALVDGSDGTLADAVAAVNALVDGSDGTLADAVAAVNALVDGSDGTLADAVAAVNALESAKGKEADNISEAKTALAEAEAESAFFDNNIATLIADDTDTMKVGISGGDNITLSIGDIEMSLGGDGDDFLYLGTEDEDAESRDVKVGGTSIGIRDNDIMDYYGTIIESPENNADDDKVVFKVPSEQVYAQISVLGSEEDLVTNVTITKPTPAELNIAKITDGNVASASGKNIIVVGGSCINTVAANLLGGKACGVEFTAKTGVNPGQVLIQTFDRGDGSLATVVAGYEAADTARGVQYLLSNNVNIVAGEKVII